jgi:hypothetical protein
MGGMSRQALRRGKGWRIAFPQVVGRVQSSHCLTRRHLSRPSARRLPTCISSGSVSLLAPAGSKPDRSKILPNVTSAYCEKLYTQARAVFSFHLCLHTCGRAASRRSRYAAALQGQPAFGSPNGAYPRTSGAGSTAARSRSQHPSAGRSRVPPGLTLIPSQRIKTAQARAAESADVVSRVLAKTDTIDPGNACPPAQSLPVNPSSWLPGAHPNARDPAWSSLIL